LDIGINRRFKSSWATNYLNFLKNNIEKKILTKSGYIKGPTKNQILNIFNKSWNALDSEIITNSFLKGGYIGEISEIYNNLHFDLKNTKGLDDYFSSQAEEYINNHKDHLYFDFSVNINNSTYDLNNEEKDVEEVEDEEEDEVSKDNDELNSKINTSSSEEKTIEENLSDRDSFIEAEEDDEIEEDILKPKTTLYDYFKKK